MKYGLDLVVFSALSAFAAAPVLAGITPTPAPVAGVGIAAFAVLGLGYRALRKRIDK